MSDRTKVELVCKAEDRVVAEVETTGDLTALTIQRGMMAVDRRRAPAPKEIQDGVQLVCRHCHEALWFRAADGELFAAMPGSVKVDHGA